MCSFDMKLIFPTDETSSTPLVIITCHTMSAVILHPSETLTSSSIIFRVIYKCCLRPRSARQIIYIARPTYWVRKTQKTQKNTKTY